MKTLLAAVSLVVLGSPLVAQTYPFDGVWDCDGTRITIADQQVQMDDEAPVFLVRAVDVLGTWFFRREDGLSGMIKPTGTSMSWLALNGETHECRRQAEARPGHPGPEKWIGEAAHGITESRVLSDWGQGIGIEFSCTPQGGALGFTWANNVPEGEVRVAVDGAPLLAYPVNDKGAIEAATPGFAQLIEAMQAGRQVSFEGRDGQTAVLGLQRSRGFLETCDA